MSTKVYEIVTERIIERIEKEGRLPWSKPWVHEAPKNLVSGKTYSGFNLWLLLMAPYCSPYFVTFKQAQKLGGTVKKGEKGWPVIFWSFIEKEGKTPGKVENIPFIRYYTVFNVEQCEGLETPPLNSRAVNTHESLAACDSIVRGMRKAPEITHNEARAYYSPKQDRVNMPRLEAFNDSPSYYHTLFHELTHSTGHESRLNRLKGDEALARFGSEPYAKEELVAEMGAAYLSGVAGIESSQEDRTIAYLQGWLSAIKQDPKLLVQAAAQAQKAADYILGTKHEEDKE